MAIIREYHTREECARLMYEDSFSSFDSYVALDDEGWCDKWEFYGEHYDYDEERDIIDWGAEPPMWDTWFEIKDNYAHKFIAEHTDEVVECCGFTLIYYNGDLFGLGIDGCGYDFYSAHWIPLYNLFGFKWHDEEK